MKNTICKSGAFLLLILSFAFFLNPKTSQAQKVALDGYCPVAYSMNKAMKGDAKYSSKYGGSTYYLSNDKAKMMFDAQPAKFLPEYGGYCATAMSMGKKVKSDPKLFSEYKDHTYLFSNKMAKDKFDASPAMFVEKANAEYAKLK